MHIERVAIIGAGVGGLTAAKSLANAGLKVIVYERASAVGGIWLYNERPAPEPKYPSVKPSIADFVPVAEELLSTNAQAVSVRAIRNIQEFELQHAPPGPAYTGLMNNIPTSLLGLKGSPWKEGTPDYVKHEVILEYIRDFARENDVERFIQFNTRVEEVAKEGDKWHVKTSTLVKESVDRGRLEYKTNEFDAVLVASGHYHAAKVPDLPGLQEWKLRWPDRVSHSRTYRNPGIFQGQNILLIGAGVSSTDIANEAGGFATKIYQVARSGPYDIPARFLPNNAERVAAIASFETGALLETDQGDSSIKLQDNEPIPAAIYLEDGRVLNGIHRILICTGYHISYPFLQALHRDNIPLEAADEQVLVTDGTQAHNLHKDIFYIPDPTLAFVGTAYSVSSFSLFEFQAIAVAAVFAGRAKLPREEEMRAEYRQRVLEKGLGRSFHVLKEGEIEYVESIVNWVNRDGAVFGVPAIEGHSNEWVRKNQERRDWVKKVFAPESTIGPPLSASATM